MQQPTKDNSSKKKLPELLVLCQIFYPELISTGQTLTELCEELTEMGMDIEVLCGQPTVVDRETRVPKYIEHRGIRIKRLWSTRFPKLNTLGRILNQLTYALSVFFYLLRDTSKKPILVLTNPPFLAVICGLMRMLGGKPYVYLIFDVYPDTAVNLGLLKEHGLLTRLWNWCNQISFKYASDIIVLGRCMKDVISKKVNGKFNDKIHVIHVWSDDKNIRAVSEQNDSNPFIERWGLKDKFVLSYSGNMGRFHDMETIMAAAKILSDYKDIVFLFIGEGYKKSWMMEFAKRWELTNCQFHTYVDRKDLGLSFQCAHVGLVSLLEGQEGLSVPSKTYGLMAAGLPVIAVMSPYAEVARMLIEEQCGIVVKPGNHQELANSILSLYNNREKLEMMGRNAKQAIDKKYNLHSAAKAYYEIIRTINSA
jgi:glycosyltransferase involved in cell wall biosynthesis